MNTLKVRILSARIKNFLFSKKCREFLVFLLFFAVASVFWLLQTLNESYETDIQVPLRLTDIPAGVVITEELPSPLRVRVKDKGSVLLNYLYGQTPPMVDISYADFATDATTGSVHVPLSDVQKELLPRLLSSTRIVSIRPDTLDFYFNRGVRKRVPVRLAGQMDTAPQYFLSEVSCSPDSVWVYAPYAVLDTLQAVYTSALRVDNLSCDTVFTTSIRKRRGVKTIPSTVEVDMKLDIYTEKTVEVPIVAVNFPATRDLRSFPPKVNVTFRVGAQRFKSITAEDFVLAVSFEELLQNKSSKLRLHLRSLPAGVSQVRIHPAEVDYLIEQVAEE